jgi:hypothetical protein
MDSRAAAASAAEQVVGNPSIDPEHIVPEATANFQFARDPGTTSQIDIQDCLD